MKLCICRDISDKDLTDHLDENPHLLGQDWNAVSFHLSQEDMVCGICEDKGQECIKTHPQNQPSALQLANG